MKKLVWLLLPVLLLAGGCLKIESNESDGIITISGGKVQPQQAVLDLMRDWQMTHESAGSQNAYSESKRTGIGFSTRKGLILPGKSKKDSSHSWISARTDDGKHVQFDIDSSTGKPTTITVAVEEGASFSLTEVTAELTRRLQEQAHPSRKSSELIFRLAPLSLGEAGVDVYESQWTATGDWTYPAKSARFEFHGEGPGMRSYSIYVSGPTPWSPRRGESEGPMSFEIERGVGTMTFEGQRTSRGGSGRVVFEPNAVYVSELTKLVTDEPAPDDLVGLFFNEMDLETARQIREAWGEELSLGSLSSMVSYRVKPEYIRGIREAGYSFSADQIVKLNSYHVPLNMLTGFKQAGYEFSPDQIIKINSYHLTVDDFVGFRDAGYNFSIDQMIKADSYHVPVEMARTLHEAGFNYSLDQLIKADSYHVPASEIVAYRDAGYNLSLDGVIKARSYHLNAADAARLKQVGYDFSLDQLIKLYSYNLKTKFMTDLYDPNYKPFSADELIKLHSYNVPAADIVTLRKAGYDLPIDEVIKARSYNVRVADAVRLRQLGYEFSLDDLIKLNSYNVPMQFMVDVYDPNYKPFTAAELLSFHQKGIDAAAIKKIRTNTH